MGTAAAGAVLILCAFTFGTSQLFIPGLACLLLASVTPPWILLVARGGSVTRTIDAERVVEDQPLEARIEIRGGRLGLSGAEILDPFAGGTIALSTIHPTLRRRPTEVRVVARFARRGPRRLEPPTLALTDPLGLVRVLRRSPASAQSVLVLPRTERLRRLDRGQADALNPRVHAGALDLLAATEVDGLRPYRPGTPASRISWTALARGAGLLERRLQVERGRGPVVVLDARGDVPLEQLDACVRAAASLTLTLAQRTGCELLLPGDRRPLQVEPDLGAWPAAHARLALLEGGPETPPPVIASPFRSAAVFYVATQPGLIPHRLLRAAQGELVLVLPAEHPPAGRAIPSFEVSGCRGYLLAGTERRAARRAA